MLVIVDGPEAVGNPVPTRSTRASSCCWHSDERATQFAHGLFPVAFELSLTTWQTRVPLLATRHHRQAICQSTEPGRGPVDFPTR